MFLTMLLWLIFLQPNQYRTFNSIELNALHVPTEKEFFDCDWPTAQKRIEMVRDYTRQGSKDWHPFDVSCDCYRKFGQIVPPPEKFRSPINQALTLHHAQVKVCFIKSLHEVVHTNHAGDIFLNPRKINKFTTGEFLAMLGHELGHYYAFYFIQRDDRARENFADIIALWTLQQARVTPSPANLYQALEKIAPRSQGDKNHASNEERRQQLNLYATKWKLL